jgi:hypothetical protein
MADLSDVTSYLASAAASAVYPNGTSQPSVANMDVRVYEGWPLPDQLDADLGGTYLAGTPPVVTPRPGGPASHVSIYPMPGATSHPFQIETKYYVIVPPVEGVSVAVTGTPGDLNNTLGLGLPTVTLSGAPNATEYVTIIADRTHIYSANGTTLASIISQLASKASVDYPAGGGNPGVTTTSNSITIPAMFAFQVNQGAQSTLGYVTHRQCHKIMVTAWSPTHVARNKIAAAIDVAIKNTLTVALSDTSIALITYDRTVDTDEHTPSTLYRRDLVYDVEYATLFTFPGYVVTSFTLQEQGGNWGLTTNPPIENWIIST